MSVTHTVQETNIDNNIPAQDHEEVAGQIPSYTNTNVASNYDSVGDLSPFNYSDLRISTTTDDATDVYTDIDSVKDDSYYNVGRYENTGGVPNHGRRDSASLTAVKTAWEDYDDIA